MTRSAARVWIPGPNTTEKIVGAACAPPPQLVRSPLEQLVSGASRSYVFLPIVRSLHEIQSSEYSFGILISREWGYQQRVRSGRIGLAKHVLWERPWNSTQWYSTWRQVIWREQNCRLGQVMLNHQPEPPANLTPRSHRLYKGRVPVAGSVYRGSHLDTL